MKSKIDSVFIKLMVYEFTKYKQLYWGMIIR